MASTDQNTRILVYLRALYSVTNTDVATLIDRYLDAYNGDKSKGMAALIAAANA